MAQTLTPPKSMTPGELSLAIVLSLLAVLSLVVAAKAYEPGYAFHAYLFVFASGAGVLAIINRFYDRPAEPPPQTIDGKPNYNFGPIKFCTIAAVIWGIAGFSVGLYIACELAFPALNLDLPWITFGRLAFPDTYSGEHYCA